MMVRRFLNLRRKEPSKLKSDCDITKVRLPNDRAVKDDKQMHVLSYAMMLNRKPNSEEKYLDVA